ncbi:MAG TPA: DegQ family serine endoprotease [Gammaproteobacteria bacterium]|nr:DegQ family serine endoprotease [Gammaproteobacteria bacterium]
MYLRNTTVLIRIAFTLCCWLVAGSVQAGGLPDFTGLVEQYSPAIVNISTTQKVKSAGLPDIFHLPDSQNDDRLNEFLRKFYEEHRGREGGEEDDEEGDESFDSNSLGSGFVVSSDGYILTNHHVVKDADQIVVRFSDRREFQAEVIGSDPRTDIALLKVDATGLPVLTMGTSENLKPGEWVLAIGSPFGFDHSVTAGIVSAKGRSLPSEQYVPFIQTDVAINPGNSGGPLFNLKGEVVGINSQIYSRTGGFMGLSFAIPIEVAMNVVDQLKTNGKVVRGWLGVYIQEITRELAESFGLKRPRGALVAQVIADSPAEKAGVKVGDVLLTFTGKPISHSSDLPPLVGRHPVGSEVELEVLRDGKEQTIKVVIDALPEDDQIEARRRGYGENKQARLGVVIAPLTEEIRSKLNVSQGVVVEDVLKGPAKKAGVHIGDVIVSINNKPVTDQEALEKLIEDLPKSGSVPMLIQREDGPVFLPLKLSE